MNSGPVGKPVSAERLLELAEAIVTIESVMHATMRAFYFVDDNGEFLFFRPGQEKDICRSLSKVNWRKTLREVEEHCV